MSEKSLNYLDLLNNQQRESVVSTEGSLLVLAGAGSGKTRVLTFRILHLLYKKLANPSQILAVTFTNKAANEMKSRITNLINIPIDRMWVGTFHSLSLRILRQHYEEIGLKKNFIIIDTDDQLKLIKNICEVEKIDLKEFNAKYYLNLIDSFKNKGITSEEVSENKYRKNDFELRKIYKIYQSELLRLNIVDFGDLILHCIKIFKKNNYILKKYQNYFKYIHVDEYQDINPIQQQWIHFLYKGNKNICCVGDDDQSIYSWRGADVTNLLNFEKNFENVTIVRLEQNYRSTRNILSCASTLISKNKGRYGKELWSKNQIGEKITINGFWETKEESIFVTDKIENIIKEKKNLSEISILFRVAAHTRSFEERLINLGLPYKIIGGLRFYERKEIKDIIAYLRLTNNLSDDLAFERIINTPKRGIGNVTVQTLNVFARSEGISIFMAASRLIETDDLGAKARSSLRQLLSDFSRWRNLAGEIDHIDLTRQVLDESGYSVMWRLSKAPEAAGRLENLKELISAMENFENLQGFLEHISLVMENEDSTIEDKVTLMTLHGAKGLEFESVFLPGWEEGLFPHQKSIEEKGQNGLEEERRLAYVGITRAKKKVFISFSMNRFYQGDWIDSMASRFIDELPEKFLEKNSFFDESKDYEDFEFNQDLETENEARSPGWLRYQKRIK